MLARCTVSLHSEVRGQALRSVAGDRGVVRSVRAVSTADDTQQRSDRHALTRQPRGPDGSPRQWRAALRERLLRSLQASPGETEIRPSSAVECGVETGVYGRVERHSVAHNPCIMYAVRQAVHAEVSNMSHASLPQGGAPSP